ncbi:DUF3889 domain-containing protein [Neobacillus muris]|uniref:DUF3889 domain-containing protein n=1 Tax=Neobacillus muris TaxID=2941334 RepID=UPI002040C7B7|nr:DUF3889 domain-containing protein [Neobacillus muris]
MKKVLASILLYSLLALFSNQAFAQQVDYEKYGRMSIAVVKADYPASQVQDYEYLGRKKLGGTNVVDSFRFQVQDKNQKFYVIVKVRHDLTNQKLINLTVETQKR